MSKLPSISSSHSPANGLPFGCLKLTDATRRHEFRNFAKSRKNRARTSESKQSRRAQDSSWLQAARGPQGGLLLRLRLAHIGLCAIGPSGKTHTRASPLEPLTAPPRAACHCNTLLNWSDYRGGGADRRARAIVFRRALTFRSLLTATWRREFRNIRKSRKNRARWLQPASRSHPSLRKCY